MTKIATSLGQLLRKIRIDSGEVLMHMANKLKMSPAFLSAIELGKRSVPSDFVTNLVANYDLSNDVVTNVIHAIEDDKRIIELNLADADDQQIDAALAFTRRVKSMSPEELEALMKIFEESDSKATNESK
jgi:transcriptional regulator with XRE-family HTH domain